MTTIPGMSGEAPDVAVSAATWWVSPAVILWLALASPQEDASRQRYGASVSRVRVDVIVTDEDGRFVDGLGLDDFIVYEDGEPQQILDAQLVRIQPMSDAAEGSVAPEASAAAAETGGIPAAPPLGMEEQGALVLVIDGLSSDRRTRVRFAREWAEYQEYEGTLSVLQAAYVIDSLGKMHELAPLSRDPEAIYVAAERAFGEPIRSDIVDEEFAALRGMMETPFDNITKAVLTYDSLAAVCDALAALPGRKALVWVSEGHVVVEPGGRTRRLPLNFEFNDPRITRRQQAFHEAANTANVSVYALDPTLVTWRRSYGSVISRSRGPVDGILAEATGSGPSLRGTRKKDSLVQTARATGGKAFPYAGNLKKALRTIEEDASRYYLLTYATPEPVGDGLYQKINVKVRDPDLNVRARAGYLDLPAGARHERTLQANMRFSLSLSELTVVAKAYRRWDPTGRPVLQVAATATDSSGRPDNDWDWFHAVAFDEDGRAVDQAHLPVGVSDPADQAALPAAVDPPFVYVHDLAVPTGVYDVTVALADEAGGRVGAKDFTVNVPKSGGWQTSDLILAVWAGGEPALSRPLLDGRVRPGDVVVAYLEVRGGERPVLQGNVRGPGSDDGTSAASVELLADDAGIYRGAVQVRLDRPGPHVFRVSVVDAPAGERRDLEVKLEVVTPDNERS